MSKKLILFVCTGNTCRSPMAEALLRKKIEEEGREMEVISAGTTAQEGDRAASQAREVLEEAGVELKDHRARRVDPDLLQASDLILTMTRGHKEQLMEMMPRWAGKIYTLKEYVLEKEDEEIQKLLELDREEVRRIEDFQSRRGQEEKRLQARREQLRRQLREVEEKLEELKREKQNLIREIKEQKAGILNENRERLDISDPFGLTLEVYRQTREEIQEFLDSLWEKLWKEEEEDENSSGS